MMTLTRRRGSVLCGLAAVALILTIAYAQAPPHPDLAGALKAIPGCLGVETAQTQSGKSVIFAWFKDKEAVKRWYYSPVHASLLKSAGADPETTFPLVDLPEDFSGPILTIASVIPKRPGSQPNPLQVEQISIELYAPLPGGAYIGGRFAPAELKVPGMRDYEPQLETAK